MKNRYRKVIFIVAIAIYILTGFIQGLAQDNLSAKNNEILTEIRVDVKYIKENIQYNRNDIKELKTGLVVLDKRVTLQEERNIYMTECINRVDKRDGWLLTIIGTFMAAMLILQIKRFKTHRREDNNGEEDN